MKIIKTWLVIMIWLALHNSVNNKANAAAWTKNEGNIESVQAVMETSVKETESETESETGGGAESKDGLETETEKGSGKEQESEIETESETGRESETKDESRLEAETEEYSEKSTETGTESESEQKRIHITGIRAAYENETRVYDGTVYIELEVTAEGIPENARLVAWGEAEAASVGMREVMPYFLLTGEGMEEYELSIEAENPVVTIVPRPLTIEISDAQKDYFSENGIETLDFLTEEAHMVKVSGFLEDIEPDGFRLPDLQIDERVLKKESPIYEDGERKEYKNAVVVKTDEYGNPTGNYCFVLDVNSEFYHPGSVFLNPPAVVGTLDYMLVSPTPDFVHRDEKGTLWVKKGTVIEVKPKKGRGFTEGMITAPLHESGTVEFELQRRSKKGEVLARSKSQEFSFSVDGEGPSAVFLVNGEQGGSDICYSRENVTVSVAEMSDRQSGICSVKTYLERGGKAQGMAGEEVYQSAANLWEETTEFNLTEEGDWRVYARLEDYVGNVTYLTSRQICIDRTPPQLEIMGITQESANNGQVKPEVVCKDANYRKGSLKVVMEGSSVGRREFAQERSINGEGECIQVLDIPREKRWDDLYVLYASAEDMAGNRTEKSIVFSVNRFGSVYKIDGDVLRKLDKYYLQEPTDLIIREFNVDSVVHPRVCVGFGEELRVLTEGKDYYVTGSGGARGWKEYRYFIPARNFRNEGIYYVILSSKDRAGNTADNRAQKLDLEFVIDRTAPSVIITGIKNGEKAKGSRTADIECRDNILLGEVEISLNGTVVAKNCEQEQQVTIYEKPEWQKLSVHAEDRAGNKRDSEEVWVHLGEDGGSELEMPEILQLKKEDEETGSEEKGTDEEKSGKAFAVRGTEKEEDSRSGDWMVIFPGMAFFSLLGVYFYKNKRVKS